MKLLSITIYFFVYFRVYYRGPGFSGTKSANVIGEANRQFTLSGLRPNSTYQFILQAINDVGPGKYSSLIPISTLPLRKCLSMLNCNISL